MNKAVTLKTLLLQDEEKGWQKNSYRALLLAVKKLEEVEQKKNYSLMEPMDFDKPKKTIQKNQTHNKQII